MDSLLLSQIHETMNVPSYHGDKQLDTLKFLSEAPLPELVKADYYNQYEKALSKVELCNNWNLGKILYTHFNGDDDVIIGDTLEEYTWKNVTIKALEIEIPYFSRIIPYLLQQGIYFNHTKSKINIVDIVIDNESLLHKVLQKPKQHKSAIIGMYFLINDRDYALISAFHHLIMV